MKILLDFLPVIIFFIVYKSTDDIILATAVLIPATLLQMLYTWVKTHKIEKMQLVTLILVVSLGGLTIALNDESFIKWKPTIVNWLFALAFLGSQFIGNKTIVERLMSSAVELTAGVWKKLNLAWVMFFLIMGAINLAIIKLYPDDNDLWINFKLFGMLGLTLIFIILQGVYISRHMKPDPTENSSEN